MTRCREGHSTHEPRTARATFSALLTQWRPARIDLDTLLAGQLERSGATVETTEAVG